MKPTTKRLGFAIVFGAEALLACSETKKAAGPPPPPLVYVTTVVRRDVPLYTEAVATLDGYVNADIRARVRGYLRTQDYKDGSSVKTGDKLFSIEEAEYRAALAAADAAVARARAAQAHDHVQVERYQGLVKTGVVSRQDLDNVSTGLADADGQVAAAAAAREEAALNLSYTTIRSPIDGIAGVALVRVGNLVGQEGPTLLTTVSQVDPMRVSFPMAEADYLKYPYREKSLDARDLAWAKKEFPILDATGKTEDGDPGVELVLSDGSTFAHRGVIVSVNRQVDSSTGTIQIQALVSNPDGALRPGQYGRVRIRRRDAGHEVLVVPERSLVSVQGTYSVGVVGPDNEVHLKKVDLGPSVHGLQLIDDGVAAGDRIVVEGVQKISDGIVVEPRPMPESPPASPASSASAGSP